MWTTLSLLVLPPLLLLPRLSLAASPACLSGHIADGISVGFYRSSLKPNRTPAVESLAECVARCQQHYLCARATFAISTQGATVCLLQTKGPETDADLTDMSASLYTQASNTKLPETNRIASVRVTGDCECDDLGDKDWDGIPNCYDDEEYEAAAEVDCFEHGVFYPLAEQVGDGMGGKLPFRNVMMGISTARQCQIKCWAWDDCESFTFSYDHGCFLLTGKYTDVRKEEERVRSIYAASGPKYCPPKRGGDEEVIGGCITRGCGYYSTPIDVGDGHLDDVATPFRCQTFCQQHDDCEAFSYDYSTLLCTLHKTEDEQTTGLTWTQLCGPRSCDLWPDPPKATGPVATALKLSAPMEDYIDGLLAKMGNLEKVCQMVISNDAFNEGPRSLIKYNVNVLWPPMHETPDFFLKTKRQYYMNSMKTNKGKRLGIPSITAVDAVHGLGTIPEATMFPHNIGLGCANDPDLMRRIGRVTALEMSAVGVEWTLAPMTAVPADYRWGRTYESFSENGTVTAALVEAYVNGLQESMANGTGVAAMCKHFLGDGATLGGVVDGDAEMGEEELIRDHNAPFIGCLRAKMMSTMPSFNDVNGIEMHQHKHYLSEILKGHYGFDGVIMGDWNAHSHIPSCTSVSCSQGINAGIDMFLISTSGGEHFTIFIKNTIAAVKNGTVTQARLDDAARRVLRLKARLGMIGPNVKAMDRIGNVNLTTIGNPEHTAVAREAVQKSAVLLKNNGGVLPLKAKEGMRVLVMGKARWSYLACGGWTLSWQGLYNDDTFNDTSNKHAISLLTSLQEHAKLHNYTVVDDEEGQDLRTNKYDVVIHVMAEDPYAEVEGDYDDGESLMHHRNWSKFGKHTYPEDFVRLKKARDYAPTTPVITIFYSGRPLYINAEINLSDAFIEAWLPCKQAGPGLTDLLFGEVDFTGKLSMSWPAHPCQFNIHKGDGQRPLFPYGYGLTYKDKHPEKDLPILDVVERNVCHNPCKDPKEGEYTWGSPDCNLGRRTNLWSVLD
ncbi:unnamed protein product [Vitrella brassicaformis CCMP3155]|uniref:Apple domain-containing protein n=2 Tax=Vitrella brassicaformis TaxID=1169539 RepID=A0A0G4FH06_VITBC|nr:unnamed protein product [Vitrella brassicaformis CCMP3155]|eukprot:CEM12745.1 unnamed protein product [Vitrella brassicaformis CCMP3155]